MEEQVNKIAKYLLMGYSEDFIKKFYLFLDAWPDKDKCKQTLKDIPEYFQYRSIKFIKVDNEISFDYAFRHDRLNIYYDKNNVITMIKQG
jgi:hypothetical protein